MFKVVFGELKKRYRFILLWKQKTAIWTFGKEQEKHLNLITVHFKTRNFNIRGSPVTDKDITFESDKILNPLEITGLHFLAKLSVSSKGVFITLSNI